MMISRTLEEMISEYRLRNCLLPIEQGVAQSFDGFDTDAIIGLRILDNYLRLLDTAPTHLLPSIELMPRVVTIRNGDGSILIDPPNNCRRIVGVMMESWQRPARIIDDCESLEARMQQSEYIRGGSVYPVAVRYGRKLLVYSWGGAEDHVTSVTAIPEPDGSTFTLDRSLLESLFDFKIQ